MARARESVCACVGVMAGRGRGLEICFSECVAVGCGIATYARRHDATAVVEKDFVV